VVGSAAGLIKVAVGGARRREVGVSPLRDGSACSSVHACPTRRKLAARRGLEGALGCTVPLSMASTVSRHLRRKSRSSLCLVSKKTMGCLVC